MVRSRSVALVLTTALVAGCSGGGEAGPDAPPAVGSTASVSAHTAAPATPSSTASTTTPSADTPVEPTPGSAAPTTFVPPTDGTPDRELLPAPADVDDATPDDAAALLAAAVLDAPDPAARQAALLTALTRSGIEVYDLDETAILPPAEPALGVSLLAGHVLAMSALPTEATVRIDEFAADVAPLLGISPERAPEVAAALEADLAAGAETATPTARFFGRFLAALRPAADAAYEHPADAAATWVSPLQTALILARLAGDLAFAAGVEVDARPAVQGWSRPSPRTVDCSLSGNDQTTVSRVANTVGAWFGAMVGLAGDAADEAAAAAGNVTDAATRSSFAQAGLGLVLQALKLILAEANFTVTFELDGGEPLVRTKFTNGPGQQRTVNARVRYEPTGAWAHCVIAAFSVLGVEPGVANDISGVTVKWRGKAGFARGNGFTGWVQFGAGSASGGDIRTTTDADGRTAIVVEGKPQRTDMSVSVPVMRRVTVIAQLDLDESSFQDSLLSAAAAALGGPFGAMVDVIAKGLSNIAGNAHAFSFDVQDWVDDYQVAWSDGALGMDGVSCDIDGAPLTVSLTGVLTGAGGSADVQGTLVVELDADLRGTASGQIAIVAGRVTMASEVTGVDVVLQLDPRTGTGTMHFTGGTVTSQVAGQIVNSSFQESLGMAPGTPVTVTAQAGDLCDEAGG